MASIGPIHPGRIPGSLVTQRLTQALAANHRSLVRLQDQLATGQRIFVPSDDPAAANRTVVLQALQERKAQFLRNVETDVSLLSSTESALGSVSEVLNRARQIALAGVGDSVTETERQALLVEVSSLIQQTVNVGNTTFRGRFLFGGSQASQAPYTLTASGAVRYRGDRQSLDTVIDFSTQLASNVTGHEALGGLSTNAGGDVNPALTMATKLRDLNGGQGLVLGPVTISLSAGSQTASINLEGADTIADLKTRIESAFTPGSISVSINGSQNGLELTASTGTVAVSSPAGSRLASDLGIEGGPAASIQGTDLNPALTLLTPLASLNAGAGIGPTTGAGLRIVNGSVISTVDLTGAVTVEDLFNRLRQADPDLATQFNPDRSGFEISTRLSGVDFSIGEAGGQNATLLGLRTLTATTPLSHLNFGAGVPASSSSLLEITRRDGSMVTVDLTSAVTLQDALDAMNAVDAGNLVAELSTVGNGISLTDSSGAGPLTVTANAVGEALGLAGTEPGSNPAVPLVGADVNPQEATGTLNALVRLHRALETGDNASLSRLATQLDAELQRVNETRGEVGGRLRTLDEARYRLEDESLQIADSLSQDFDADLATVLTQLLNQQSLYQAILQTSAQMMQLGLINYL